MHEQTVAMFARAWWNRTTGGRMATKRASGRPQTDAPNAALSKAAQIRALVEVEALREWCAWVRGDPKLSAWEEAFATSVFQQLDAPGRRFLSRRQKAMVDAISAKTGFHGDPIPHSGDDADDDADDNVGRDWSDE
jgi:hypothetical protein